MDNFQLCKDEISQSKLLLQLTGRHPPVKAEKVNTNAFQTSIIVTSSSQLQSMQTPQLSAVLKSEVSVSTPSSRKKSLKNSEVPNVIWKPLLPRPPNPIVPAKRRLPTPPAMPSAPGTPITPREEDSSTSPPDTPLTVKSDLMPMLLEAAAHAALRDKRQERMVKNRAAAYESRKRKREEAERLTTENLEMKAHIRELQHKIVELTVENERFKQLLSTKKN
ncbi:11272_t:CDS:1 [Funneliformis caledonium]|uniref:11272_t:CDS:1 n=2 Tax=Funneliformis TaxID=1117308 RepID=A0A9N9AJA2_9GLOM|nr:11272_t:CDS:1 [Funneliformis caledonium]CAG8550375.1 12896_t:CDS:1 [Funneliformis mosseae]